MYNTHEDDWLLREFDGWGAWSEDLTFYGPPQERNEMRAELTRRVEEIESGNAKLLPADEVFKQLRERLGGNGES